MNRSVRRFGPLGWLGVLLCAIAIVVVGLIALDRSTSGPAVRLADGPHHLVLPAHTTYGIYVDDANNSGYSEQCSAIDAHRSPVRMGAPSWSLSASDTEMLDMVYDTGSGDLTISCSVPGELVTTRPVPNYWLLLLGGLASAGMVLVGGVLILIQVARGRSGRR